MSKLWICCGMVLAFGLAGVRVADAQVVACDVDLSGRVDAVDVQLVINAALGLETTAVYTNIDFNPTGATNAVDVQLVINAALGLEVDRDLDGLVDAAEANLGTDPDVFDTDGGGVGDGQEVIIDGTDPLDPSDDIVIGRPTANFTAFPTTGNAPLAVQFTDTSDPGLGPITQWSWTFGDGGTSNAQNPNHEYTAPGTFTVTLVITNQVGISSLVRADFITVTEVAGIRWIGGAEGEWGNPDNWQGGQVPGENDRAIVEETVPPVTVLVTATTNVGDVFMNNNNLTVRGSNVILRARGTLQINGVFTLENGARLEADRSASNVEAAGVVNINNHAVMVRSGGQVSFPNLSSYTFVQDASPTVFDVAGTSTPAEGSVPSRLLMPMLTTLTFDTGSAGFRTLLIRADSSGELDLSGLATVNTPSANDRVEFRVAAGGSIALDALVTPNSLILTLQGASSMSLPLLAGTLSDSSISVSDAGQLDMPDITAFNDTTITVSGILTAPNLTGMTATALTVNNNGQVALDAVTAVTGGTISVRNNAVVSMNSLTSLSNTPISIREAAVFNLPALTTYSPTGTSSNMLDIHNTAVFNVPLLANINQLLIQLRAGATLSLPLVTSYTYLIDGSPTVFDVDGTLPPAQGSTPSQLTLANLSSITYNTGSAGFRNFTARASANGLLDLSALVTIVTPSANDRVLFLANTAGQVLLDSLATPAAFDLTAQGGSSITLPLLTGAYSGAISVTGGGSISLPQVTSLTNSSATVNGTLSIPNLNTLVGTSLTFQGTVSNAYPNVTTMTGGSIILQNSAELTLANLTTIGNTNISLRDDSELSAAALTSYSPTETNILFDVRNRAELDAPLLANINNLNISVQAGAQLSLPLVTSYTFIGNASPTVFEATGALPVGEGGTPSTLTLANLTSLTFNSGTTGFRTMTIRGISSGIVDISTVATLSTPTDNDSVVFFTNTGGQVLLDNLDSPTGFDLTAQGGTSLLLPSQTGTYSGTISVTGDGSISMPLVTGVSNSSATVNGTLLIPNLDTIASTNLTFQGASSNAYPALTTLTGGSIILQNSALLTLENLAAIENTNISLRDDSELSVAALTTYSPSGTNILFDVRNHAELDAPLLADIDNLNISVQAGAQLSLPQVTSYTFLGNASPTVFEATGTLPVGEGGTPSTLTLANITSLTFNSGTTGFRTMTVRGISSGIVDLSGVAIISTPTDNDSVVFFTNAGGQVLLDSLNTPEGFDLTAQGGTSLLLPALTGTFSGTISVTGGGSISMPQVTVLSNTTATVNGTLLIPNLDLVASTNLTFQGASSNAYPALTTVTGGAITLRDNSELTLEILTGLLNTNITLHDTSQLSLPALTAYSPSETNITLDVRNQAVLSVPLLSNIDNLNVIVQAGAQLSLPEVDNYTFLGNASPTPFDATGTLPVAQGGTPSTLTLANLTSLTFNSGSAGFRTLTVRARSDGQVLMPLLATVAAISDNDSVVFRAESNGFVDIPSLDPLPAVASLSVATGGTINNPNAKADAKASADAAHVYTDLSGDGLTDQVSIGAAPGVVLVTLADGTSQAYAVGADPAAIVVADVDGDGWRDIVVANRGSGDVSVLFGAGNGAFYAEDVVAVDGAPVGIAVVDTNNDGHADLVVILEGAGSPLVLLGDGTGVFAAEE